MYGHSEALEMILSEKSPLEEECYTSDESSESQSQLSMCLHTNVRNILERNGMHCAVMKKLEIHPPSQQEEWVSLPYYNIAGCL